MEKKFHKILLTFPEVETVVSKIGFAEIASDPMGPELSDPIITLKPRSQWNTAESLPELTDKIRDKLESSMPSVGFNFTQPIALRVDELISGVKSQVAKLSLLEGPNQISREEGQRRIVIECNMIGSIPDHPGLGRVHRPLRRGRSERGRARLVLQPVDAGRSLP